MSGKKLFSNKVVIVHHSNQSIFFSEVDNLSSAVSRTTNLVTGSGTARAYLGSTEVQNELFTVSAHKATGADYCELAYPTKFTVFIRATGRREFSHDSLSRAIAQAGGQLIDTPICDKNHGRKGLKGRMLRFTVDAPTAKISAAIVAALADQLFDYLQLSTYSPRAERKEQKKQQRLQRSQPATITSATGFIPPCAPLAPATN
jgi:hypothetical protein